MLCQKDLQEDGWGGEGGTAGNIVGELGSIPTYPTFIPTGPKKLFCRNIMHSKGGMCSPKIIVA